MSHLTLAMVEEFFAREEENARGVLRKVMDTAMDTIFKQMKRKLMQLAESGPEADETAHELDNFADPQHHQQQLYESSNQIASTSTNVDDVTSNNEKGSENASTVLVGQEGEHMANDSNEQSQSSDLLAPSTSTGQSSNRIDVSSSPPETVQSSNVNQEHLDAQCDHIEPQLNNEDTSSNVDDVTSNNEKGSENASTVLEGQEGEHIANDSNDQTVAQSCDAFSPSTSTGRRSIRIDVSWPPSQTVQFLNDSHIKQKHLNELVDNEPQLNNEDTSTRVDDVTSNNEKGSENASTVLEGQEGEHTANDSNDQTVAQSSDAFSPSTSAGRRSNRVAELKKQLPTVSTDRNVTKLADLEQNNDSGSRPTKQARLENVQEQGAMLESSDNARHVPSTSTGRKRQSSSTSRSVNNKQPKTVTTRGSNKHLCKSAGCGKSFLSDKDLVRHERIHLDIKPFLCTWPGCGYSSVRKNNLVLHVRVKHFKLPQLQSEQTRLKIVDNRNPEDYIQVNDQLLKRRLE